MFSTTFKIVHPQVIEEFLEAVEPGQNEAIVRIDRLAVCKADIRYYLGNRAKEVLDQKYPLTPIHEAVGTILKDPTHTFKKGDRVILVPNMVDESKCSLCKQQRCKDYDIEQNYCPNARFASSTCDGFLREYITYDVHYLVAYDKSIDPNLAVFAELLSVANAAIRRVNITKDDHIGIWGDGIMAYMVAILIEKVYHHPVTIIGLDEKKMSRFKDAHKIIAGHWPTEKDINFTIAFECVGGRGSESALSEMIEHASIGATIVLMGVSEDKVAIATRKILEKGLTLKGVTRSSVHDFQQVSQYLNQSEMLEALRPLVLSVCSLNNVADIYTVFEEEIANTTIVGKNIMEFPNGKE